MYLKNIKLTNFRNYQDISIDFINGINLFVGDNAQGKTNIIEAIYLSAFGKSYRTIKDMEVIRFEENYARVETFYEKSNIENQIEIYIDHDNKKIIKHNGIKATKLSDHVGELLIVIFSPDSLDIVKGAPAKRRAFIDMICSQLSKSYLVSHQEYMKCLKLKNTILKKEQIDKEYLYVLHEKMSEYIEKIVKFRKDTIQKIEEKAIKIQSTLTNETERIQIEYVSDFINLKKSEIKNILDSHLYIEEMRKSSIKGIQRDDINIYINDLLVGMYGSQGQNRTALLTLKLADFEVLKEEKNETPILLLDDIMSELDANRISFLLEYINQYQSIVTTTDSSFIKNPLNIKISKVLKGGLEF